MFIGIRFVTIIQLLTELAVVSLREGLLFYKQVTPNGVGDCGFPSG